jgi:hypothetical protein
MRLLGTQPTAAARYAPHPTPSTFPSKQKKGKIQQNGILFTPLPVFKTPLTSRGVLRCCCCVSVTLTEKTKMLKLYSFKEPDVVELVLLSLSFSNAELHQRCA